MSIWKEYSYSYIKVNKASTISIIAAAFISSLLLALTCGIFYNIWADEVRLIKLKEGDWHGRVTGTLTKEAVEKMECNPNVKQVIIKVNEASQDKTAYVYLYHPGKVYKDIPKLVKQAGLKSDSTLIEYHDKLLADYFIFAKGHNPPLILLVYLITLLLSCISLILIIYNAFGISMTARQHQLGILQSIGATSGQLRSALISEAILLCLVPILLGVLTGTGLCLILIRFISVTVRSVRDYELIFQYHPLIFVIALLVSVLTMWFSALIPARKLSGLSPLEAIRAGEQQRVKRMKHFSLLGRLLGVEGELADKSLFTRKKAFRTATLSLTISFLVFSAFLNLETISRISTGYTFFERYKNTWDLMVSVRNPEGRQEDLLTKVRSIPGVKSCISYQRLEAYTKISDSMLSNELRQLGGLNSLKDTGIPFDGEYYHVDTPLCILDDESFQDYCLKVGVTPDRLTASKTSSILINRIWDNINSNRRYKKMLLFLNVKKGSTMELLSNDKNKKSDKSILVNIAGTTDKLPSIREEFEDFTLIQVMPMSTWKRLDKNFEDTETYFTLLAESENDLERIENTINQLMSGQYDYSIDNKYRREKNNTDIRNAYKIVIGSLAGLLACIGLANVFSNTLGMIYQRKRELSRYISVGLTPRGALKVIMLEATALAIKPIVIGILINIPLVMLALNASLIRLDEFLGHIPALPIIIFAVVIIIAVEAAYYIGGRRLNKLNLVGTLKDDTMI